MGIFTNTGQCWETKSAAQEHSSTKHSEQKSLTFYYYVNFKNVELIVPQEDGT